MPISLFSRTGDTESNHRSPLVIDLRREASGRPCPQTLFSVPARRDDRSEDD